MRQSCFSDPLIMFISIFFPMYEVLCLSTPFPMLSNFFFFIDNHWQWYWFLVLILELWFHTSCQKVFIEHVVNSLSFWKFQLKHSWANILWDPKRSIFLLVQLLWELIQLNILVLQPHIVSNLQFLRISLFLVILPFHVLLCFFYWLCSLLPTLL